MQTTADQSWSQSLDAIRATHPALVAELEPMRFLCELLAWWRARGNEIAELEFVNQDEFTIDIVVPLGSEAEWLVLDCT